MKLNQINPKVIKKTKNVLVFQVKMIKKKFQVKVKVKKEV